MACYSGSTVHWLIKKQPITATSTIEAEFIAISHAIDEVLWIKRIVEELGMEKSLVIKLDSLEAIENVKNGPTSKMKKLDLRRWHGLENLEIGQIQIDHIRGEEQLTDYLTKPKINQEAMKRILGGEEGRKKREEML